MFICCECCVLSGRGLCDGLITRPEESYRLWRVIVCDQETPKTRRLKPATGLWKIQPQWVVTPRKQTNKQTWFNFLYDFLSEAFVFHPRSIPRDTASLSMSSCCFNQNLISSTDLTKNSENKISWKCVKWKPQHD
jgi:hypothetical protein